jgi:hypothetical protein
MGMGKRFLTDEQGKIRHELLSRRVGRILDPFVDQILPHGTAAEPGGGGGGGGGGERV